MIDAHGRPQGVDTLSSGTREQLYLTVRLGLALEYAQRAVALPLLLDDVFVNFDPDRRTRAARALARVAERTQVLFLSCHPPTIKALGDACPHARKIELS